jgi:hypothetical protein
LIHVVEETDSGDGTASVAPEKVVQSTGPPVKAAQTKLTVFQVRYIILQLYNKA